MASLMKLEVAAVSIACAACSAAHGGLVPCAEGEVLECACEGEAESSAVCRGGALDPCRCVDPCDDGVVEACACLDGREGTRACGSGRYSACSCERPPTYCEPDREYACRCGGGGVGVQHCDPAFGVLGPCACGGADAPALGMDAAGPDGRVPDAGARLDAGAASDASWPDGCMPTPCETLGCGVHSLACGLALDCGPCEARQVNLELQARHILWDPTRAVLYASLPSREVGGNSVVGIDPLTLERRFSVFVGSEPGRMALSDDGDTLYVALDGASAVRRVNLATGTATLEIPLPPEADQFVGDLAVVPGQPSSVLVARRTATASRQLFVFDEAVARGAPTRGSVWEIEMADAETLYGVNRGTSGVFATFVLEPAGVREVIEERGLGSLFDEMTLDRGRLYSGNVVIDPSSWTEVGRLPAFGVVQPHAARNRIYSLQFTAGETTRALRAYDATTLGEVGRVALDALEGNVRDLVRWETGGSRGVAYREEPAFGEPTSRVVVVTTNLVASERP
jgi:hypothetical protein